jgi:predicted Zn-dependent protease with MMP-like domain
MSGGVPYMFNLEAEVNRVLDELTDETNEALDGVEFAIFDGPADPDVRHLNLPADVEGVYEGIASHPLNPSDPDGDWNPPIGTVWLNGRALTDADTARAVIVHEIGHALGMDEEEVDAMLEAMIHADG